MASQKLCVRLTTRHLIFRMLAFHLIVGAIGCSGATSNDAVRPDLAKETLITALSAWKDGQKVEALQAQTPSIVVQDMDWSAGKQLREFSLQGDGRAVGANLSIEVELTLQDANGRTSKSKVWYLVGTDPALTVFRDMLHP